MKNRVMHDLMTIDDDALSACRVLIVYLLKEMVV
jgi:hypothetical protein